VYIHYSVRNMGNKPVNLTSLTLTELVRNQRPEVSLMGVLRTQVEEAALQSLGKVKERQLSVFQSERQHDSLQPGEVTQGVLVVRESLSSPVILQLAISADIGAAMTKATVVF
jgi:hypothetical protein